MDINVVVEPKPRFITKEYKGEVNGHQFWVRVACNSNDPEDKTYELDFFFKAVPREVVMKRQEILEMIKKQI